VAGLVRRRPRRVSDLESRVPCGYYRAFRVHDLERRP
jgi:hypothetical protein